MLLSSPTTHGGKATMRILITGSSGQLGAAIAQQLSTKHEPVGLDIVPGKWTQHVVNIHEREKLFYLTKGIEAIIHIASLHQPQLAIHSHQSFIETNVTGTLNLLEAGLQAGIQRFVYTSTTSLYGHAMTSSHKAIWVTEELQPRPRDIYDHTKIMAEKLCQHFALQMGLPAICLRVARFFAEPPEQTAIYRLYRGVDVRDVAAAHVLAVTNQHILFDIFNIAARSPFQEGDTTQLFQDAPAVLRRYIPDIEQIFARHSWRLPKRIDRVYVTEKAESMLGYQPIYDFKEYIQEYGYKTSSCQSEISKIKSSSERT
jgi:UDP-glucose 4-epimerase